MNFETYLLEDYVNFIDTTKKQSNYYKKTIFLFAIIKTSFLFYLLFKYLNE